MSLTGAAAPFACVGQSVQLVAPLAAYWSKVQGVQVRSLLTACAGLEEKPPAQVHRVSCVAAQTVDVAIWPALASHVVQRVQSTGASPLLESRVTKPLTLQESVLHAHAVMSAPAAAPFACVGQSVHDEAPAAAYWPAKQAKQLMAPLAA